MLGKELTSTWSSYDMLWKFFEQMRKIEYGLHIYWLLVPFGNGQIGVIQMVLMHVRSGPNGKVILIWHESNMVLLMCINFDMFWYGNKLVDKWLNMHMFRYVWYDHIWYVYMSLIGVML